MIPPHLLLLLLILLQLQFLQVSSSSSFAEPEGPARDLLDARIIGGDIVSSNLKYPYFVSLTPSNDNNFFFCGGTLIATDLVLTAAHCLYDLDPVNDAVSVVVGHTKVPLSENPSGSYEVIDVESFTIHPEYGEDSTSFSGHDFAVLKLVSSSQFETVILDDDSYHKFDENSKFRAIGFGLTQEYGDMSDELRDVEVTHQPQVLCQLSYYPAPITTSMICAADPGKDSCNGDSGGPLIAPGPNGSRIQVGVTSWGYGCADPSFPGVYARVASSYGWINSFITNNATQVPSAVPDASTDGIIPSISPSVSPNNTPSSSAFVAGFTIKSSIVLYTVLGLSLFL